MTASAQPGTRLDIRLKTDIHQQTTGGSKSAIPAWLLVLAALLFLAAAGVYAFSLTFSYFSFYDDEGYLMITVRGYLEGHPLYDSVFTGYGPVYYLYEWLVHAFASLPVTHDVTRILCIVHWLAASAILALAGGLMARSAPLAFFIFMQATIHLRHLAREPGHPQEVVILLLALSALVAAREWKRPWMMVLLGSIGAACALTKINVGAFFGSALLLALSCCSPFFRDRRPWFWGLLLFMGAQPFVLMREHLAEGWARDYSAQAGAAILAAGAVSYVFAGERRTGFLQWVQTGIAFAGLSAFLVAVMLFQGTSFHGLFDSLIVGPSKLDSLFCFPLQAPNSLWSGATALWLAMIVGFCHKRLDRLRLPIAIGKSIYGILGTLALVADARIQLCYLLPWAWLAVVRGQENGPSGPRDSFGRAFICLMAVWQGLQAYPCAGTAGCPSTQVSIATFLLILVFSLCLHDAIKTFAREPWSDRYLRDLSSRTLALVKALVFTSLLYLFVVEWCMPVARWRAYASVPSLELPGARYLRLDEFQSEIYRTLAEYLRTQCDTFVVIPGLNSLYFWAGKTPPTYFNINGETILPSERQQTTILAALRQAKRPLVVINEQGLRFGMASERLAKSPFGCFLRGECREVRRFDGFRILAPTSSSDHLSAIP